MKEDDVLKTAYKISALVLCLALLPAPIYAENNGKVFKTGSKGAITSERLNESSSFDYLRISSEQLYPFIKTETKPNAFIESQFNIKSNATLKLDHAPTSDDILKLKALLSFYGNAATNYYIDIRTSDGNYLFVFPRSKSIQGYKLATTEKGSFTYTRMSTFD